MTNIRFGYDNDFIIGFSMLGHACFSKNCEPDIVCASLSSISQMTVNGIIDFLGEDENVIDVESDERNGNLIFMLKYPAYCNETVQQMFKSLKMYVMQLEEIYPKNIKVRGD